MADQTTDLAIVIEAVNKASAQLKQVEKDLGGLSKTVASSGVTASTTTTSFGSLVAGVATGTVIAQVAMRAFESLANVVKGLSTALFDVAKTASEIEGIGIAMHVVANNAGITATQVDKVRDSVVNQNVTTEAANRLMTDLIRNQLDYAQATELATAAQNIAVASGMSSSETIERISLAIASGNTWNLRQLGLVQHLDDVYEAYGETLNKTSDEMTEQERKQAIVNYVLSEGVKYAGAYDQAMQNASKVMRSTNDRVKEISYSFGKLMEPALYAASKAVYDTVNSIVKWAKENEAKLRGLAKMIGDYFTEIVNSIRAMAKSIPWNEVIAGISFVTRGLMQQAAVLKMAANAVQIFVRFLDAGVRTIYEFGSAMFSLMKGDFSGLVKNFRSYRSSMEDITTSVIGDIGDIGQAWKNSLNSQTFDLATWWKSIEEIEGTGWEDRLKTAEIGGEKLTSSQRDALTKMLRDIEKANRDYQQAVEKRAKDFQESFDDLVMSHRDTIKQLTDDLDVENRDYREKLVDLLEDYNKSMEDIEERHADKTKSIMDDMEEERKKALEEIEKITEAYNEEVTLIQREGEDRLSNLKAQLDRERALGANANQAKIDALEQMIAEEQAGLDGSLEEKEDKLNEEISDINEALDDKLAKLQESLDAENQAYEEAFAERKQQYEDDIADAKAAYEEKRKKLQEELDKELMIRQKYADDFNRIGDKIAEDDITRLVRTFNETQSEMEREHQERLVDIKYQAFQGGDEFGASFAAGFDNSYPQVKARLNQMSSDINNVLGQVNSLNTSAGQIGDYYTPNNYPGDFNFRAAKGGIYSTPTLAGEAGAEVILPLSFPKRMAQIMQSLGMSSGGGGSVTQNFYVTVNSPQDVDLMMERAGFAMKTGGGYRV